MKIRLAESKDKENVISLVKGLYSRSAPFMIKRWNKNYERFRKCTLIIEDNKKIIAYIGFGVKKDSLYIGDLYIKPKYRRKGLGTKLINAVEKIKKIINKVNLIVDVIKKDQKALKFYKKNGFKILKSKNKELVEMIR